MKWKLRGDRPIYAQLIEHLQRGVLIGEYPPGSAVPSVRALALEAEVNPNTMQKALAELEAQGLMQTHRTAGRTVTEDKSMIDSLKEKLAKSQVEAFFEGMRSIGIDEKEAVRLITSHNSGDDGTKSMSESEAGAARGKNAKRGEPGAQTGRERSLKSEADAARQEEAPNMKSEAAPPGDNGANKEVM